MRYIAAFNAMEKQLATRSTSQLQDLSPELQYLIKLERQQNQQAKQLEQVNERLDAACEAFSLSAGPDWKKEDSKTMSEKIIAYKGMDKNMCCRGKQYEIGKTYTEDKAICCISGMHACENPLDVFQYYRPDGKNRFFEVECSGAINKGENDSKLSCTELKITGELSLAKFIRLSVQTTYELSMKRAKKKTSGDYSSAATSGDYSSATATGCYCRAQAEGKNSLAIANGAHGKARGVLGCYLVLTEYDDDGDMLWAKIAKVDGAAIKENVWYTLKNGEFEEARG